MITAYLTLVRYFSFIICGACLTLIDTPSNNLPLIPTVKHIQHMQRRITITAFLIALRSIFSSHFS